MILMLSVHLSMYFALGVLKSDQIQSIVFIDLLQLILENP